MWRVEGRSVGSGGQGIRRESKGGESRGRGEGREMEYGKEETGRGSDMRGKEDLHVNNVNKH